MTQSCKPQLCLNVLNPLMQCSALGSVTVFYLRSYTGHCVIISSVLFNLFSVHLTRKVNKELILIYDNLERREIGVMTPKILQKMSF